MMKSVIVVAALVAGGSAMGQAFTVTGQARTITGHALGTLDGIFSEDGPRTVACPADNLGEWTGSMHLDAVMTGDAVQTSLCTGDQIRIDAFSMVVGGGGGPDSNGWGTFENRIELDVQVNQTIELRCQGEISSGPWVTATFIVSGPGFFAARASEPAGRPLSFSSVSGRLQPGNYHISLSASGEVSFVGPGGNGSGAGISGGPITLFAFPAQCTADFNGDGFVDFFDYDDYVACFETGACPPGRTADVNGDDFVDFFDYDDFVEQFGLGC